MATSLLNPALLLSTLLLLASSVHCAPIIDGHAYFLQLARKNYCGGGKLLLSLSNSTTCRRPAAPVLRRPLPSGAAPFSAWRLLVPDRNSNAVAFTPVPQPNGIRGSCLGAELVVSKPRLCLKEPQADTVTINKIPVGDSAKWMLMPVRTASGATEYRIVSYVRRAPGQPCLKYLGASGPCHNPGVKVYNYDDGKGTQRWVLVPFTPPGPPVIAGGLGPEIAGKYPFAWPVSWKEGKKGMLPTDELYSLICVNPRENCTDAPVATLDGIPRGTRRGVLQLPPGTQADCYVVAQTGYFGPICSKPVFVTTPPVSGYRFPDFSWIPSDTYINITLEGGGTYFAPGVEEKYNITCDTVSVTLTRSKPSATLAGLDPDSSHSCILILDHPTIKCAIRNRIWTTELPSRPPGTPTGLQLVNPAPDDLTVVWNDGMEGNPDREKYYLTCVAPGAGCDTKANFDTSPVQRNAQGYSLSGLKPGTSYDCYVVARSEFFTVCSQPLAVATLAEHRLPSAALNVSGTVTPTFWEATWEDAKIPGYPKETYRPFCNPAALGNCSSSCSCSKGDDRGNTTVAKGTMHANVFNLLPNTQYNCYIQAENSEGNVCSSVYSIKTPAMPPPRPPSPPVLIYVGRDGTIRWNDSSVYALPKVETYSIIVRVGHDPSPFPSGANSSCLPINDSAVVKRDIPRGVQQASVGAFSYFQMYAIYVVAQAEGHCTAISQMMGFPEVWGADPGWLEGWCAAPMYWRGASAVNVLAHGQASSALHFCKGHSASSTEETRWTNEASPSGLIEGPPLKANLTCGYSSYNYGQNFYDTMPVTFDF